MHDSDRLALQQLLRISKFATYASEQLNRVIANTAKTANAIGAATSQQLAELEQRGQLTEPLRLLILDRTQNELDLLVGLTSLSCDAVVRMVSVCATASGV